MAVNKSSSSFQPARPIGFATVSGDLHPGPNAYAVGVQGECLAPVYCDGDMLVCDPDEAPQAGDYVCIWWKDEQRTPGVKRLVLGIMPTNIWGMKGDFDSLMICEQLNPPRTFQVNLSQHVRAVHKVIGKAEREEFAILIAALRHLSEGPQPRSRGACRSGGAKGHCSGDESGPGHQGPQTAPEAFAMSARSSKAKPARETRARRAPDAVELERRSLQAFAAIRATRDFGRPLDRDAVAFVAERLAEYRRDGGPKSMDEAFGLRAAGDIRSALRRQARDEAYMRAMATFLACGVTVEAAKALTAALPQRREKLSRLIASLASLREDLVPLFLSLIADTRGVGALQADSIEKCFVARGAKRAAESSEAYSAARAWDEATRAEFLCWARTFA